MRKKNTFKLDFEAEPLGDAKERDLLDALDRLLEQMIRDELGLKGGRTTDGEAQPSDNEGQNLGQPPLRP